MAKARKRKPIMPGRPLNVKGDRNWTDPRYNEWRKQVKKRDGYTCQKCGKVGTGNNNTQSMICHHIRRWADIPALRFMVSNGVTLCKKCHREVTGNEDAYIPLFTLKVSRNAQKKKG